MREIRFRAWSPSKKKMMEDVLDECGLWGRYQFHGSSISKICGPTNEEWTEGTDYIVMQFTGLKDKNGKDIYDGDVVCYDFSSNQNEDLKDDKFNYEVKWGSYSDGEYVSNVECWMAGDWPLSDHGGMYGIASHTIESIGNIYESPELIDKG